MKYLVIDTETNGLFDFTKPADAPGQPRLANLAMILLNEELETEASYNFFIKPDGWTIPPEAEAVHGITLADLEEKGVPVKEVLEAYSDFILKGYAVAAFNAQFDVKQMRGELRRAGMPDLFEKTQNICLMRAATDVVKAPKKTGKGYKFPKLSEACEFFKIPQPAAHSALGDAESAVAILKALQALARLPLPEVHFAKEKPAAGPVVIKFRTPEEKQEQAELGQRDSSPEDKF